MSMLKVENLGITFGGLHAVENLSLEIEKNELYGLIGPNGAGKTTVFNMLTGVYKPTQGHFWLDGEELTGRSSIEINRKGIARQLFNIQIVWLATGLWHGAAWNFVLWGLLFAVLLTLEKLWLLPILEQHRPLGHLYTLFAVLFGFVLFDAASVSGAWETICALFGGGRLPAVSAEAVYELRSYAVLLLTAILGATPLPKRAFDALARTRAGQATLTVLEPLGLTALLAVCTAFLVDGSFNPFLYFRF